MRAAESRDALNKGLATANLSAAATDRIVALWEEKQFENKANEYQLANAAVMLSSNEHKAMLLNYSYLADMSDENSFNQALDEAELPIDVESAIKNLRLERQHLAATRGMTLNEQRLRVSEGQYIERL